MSRQCFNEGGQQKRQYATSSEAKLAARKLRVSPQNKWRGGRIRAYRCGSCQAYHIGHALPGGPPRFTPKA